MIYVKDYDEEREKDRFRDMLVRTNRTLSFYKNKCSTLESSCAYYKNELIKAVRKL